MRKNNSMDADSCPMCAKNDKVVAILYGEPTPASFKKAEKGLLKIGGCLIGEESAKYFCRRCEHSFGKYND